jgi:hypothetical protein
MVALTGARAEFMYHYFPSTFEKGVGFGATWPGMSWIAGGWIGLLIGGFVYGLMLGGINIAFRMLRDERLFWAYLFAMTWFCAVGGNIHESLDKMLVAASPGIIWYLFNRFVKSKTEDTTKKSSPTRPRRRRITRASLIGDDSTVSNASS